MLTTPAGMSVSSAISRPSTVAHHGVSGAGLSTTVLPAARAGPSLARLIWWGTFHGVMAPTTPVASRRTQRCDGMPRGEASPEVGLPLVALGQIGHPSEGLDRRVELGRVGERDRRARLGHGHGPDLVGMGDEGRLQLAEAADPQPDVGRPAGRVEGPAGGADGVVEVLGAAVGHHAEHLLGGRVDRLEGPARPGRPELSVDQQPLLPHHPWCPGAAIRPSPDAEDLVAAVLGHRGQRQLDVERLGQLERRGQVLVGQRAPRPAWRRPVPCRRRR